jgi:hypothetical protein
VLLELGGSGLYGISHFSISLAQRQGSPDGALCATYGAAHCSPQFLL